MFDVFTSFADFDGCTDDERLWCFDCVTREKLDRVWATSDLSAQDAEMAAREYARATYGDELEGVVFFDPCDDDFLGNFPWWYANPANRQRLRIACEIEASIPPFRGDEVEMEIMSREIKRGVALDVLRNAGFLMANVGALEGTVMRHIIRDTMATEQA